MMLPSATQAQTNRNLIVPDIAGTWIAEIPAGWVCESRVPDGLTVKTVQANVPSTSVRVTFKQSRKPAPVLPVLTGPNYDVDLTVTGTRYATNPPHNHPNNFDVSQQWRVPRTYLTDSDQLPLRLEIIDGSGSGPVVRGTTYFARIFGFDRTLYPEESESFQSASLFIPEQPLKDITLRNRLRLAVNPYVGDTPPESTDLHYFVPLRCAASQPLTPFGALGVLLNFRRVSSGDGLDATANLFGELHPVNPIASEPPNRIEKARISVYEQTNGYAMGRSQFPGDSEYRTHLRSLPKVLVHHQTIDAEAAGTFSVNNLPQFDKQSIHFSAKKVYMVVVDQAVSDEFNLVNTNAPKTSVHFSPAYVPDLTLPLFSTLNIGMDSLDGPGQKLSVIEALSRLSTNNYAEVEQEAKDFVDQLINNPALLTPERDEAVRRAVWAERVAVASGDGASELLSVSMKGLSTVISDFLLDVTKSESLRLRTAKVKTGKFNTAAEQNNLSIDNLTVNAIPNITVKDLQIASRAEMSETTSNIIGLLKPGVEKILSRTRVPKERQSAVAGYVVTFVRGYVNLLKDQYASGARKGFDGFKLLAAEIFKQTFPPYASRFLLDGDNPNSFYQYTKPSLQFSVDQMKTWAVSDRVSYEVDRAETVRIISRINRKNTDLLVESESSLAVASIAGTAQTFAGFFSEASSHAKAIETGAKVLKYVNNGSAALQPITHVYGDLANEMQAGIYAAYGMSAPTPFNATDSSGARARRVASHPPTVPEVSTAFTNMSQVLDVVLSEIEQDQIGPAILHTYDGANSYYDLRQAWLRALNHLLLLSDSASLGLPDETFLLDQQRTALVEAKLDALILEAQFGEAVSAFFANALSGEYPGPQDRNYQLDRANALRAHRDLRFVLDGVHELLAPLVMELNRVLIDLQSAARPVLIIDALSIESGGVPINRITQTSQTFTVSVRIENTSDQSVDLDHVQIGLSPTNRPLQIVGQPDQNIGSLGAGQSQNLTWMLSYDGTPEPEAFTIQVEAVPLANDPTGFLQQPAIFDLAVDPDLWDADRDGIPTSYELITGLDTMLDDAQLDFDDDLVSNLDEYRIGTLAHVKDSDGDGLEDGEEISGGLDGFRTDPTTVDTDRDGSSDEADGHPTDRLSILPPETNEEAVVAIPQDLIVLSADSPSVSIAVNNSGGGSLYWTAVTDSPWLQINPALPGIGRTAPLTIGLSSSVDYDLLDGLTTEVTVYDLSGATADMKTIQVSIGEFVPPDIVESIMSANGFNIVVQTLSGTTYVLERAASILTGNWIEVSRVVGDGSPRALNDSSPDASQAVYRIRSFE
jgi:hypothetical protein